MNQPPQPPPTTDPISPPLSPPLSPPPQPDQINQSKPPHLKKVWKIPLIISLVIGIVILFTSFLTIPFLIKGNPIKPFKSNQYVLGEKISYIFSSPQVGDRVIFNNFSQAKNFGSFVGVITEISHDGYLTKYTIQSGETKPWEVSRDKIKGRVYYPFISRHNTLLQVKENLPLPLPTIASENQSFPPPTTPTQAEQPPSPTTTPNPTADWKTYTDENYEFSFVYPQNWEATIQAAGLTLSNIANGHTIWVRVYAVTGFGYCYKYGDEKEIIVGGKASTTSDGIGGTKMCDEMSGKDMSKEMSNRGNTFVLIPPNDDVNPVYKIHISYDYPLDEINLAKSNLNQILSTFKFID